MIFFKCLFFLFFINLHNSFKIISYVNHKTHNKLFMWCDYYIEERLSIYYNDNSCYRIKLNRERGYYSDIYDDFIIDINIENSNLTEWEKIKKYNLTPRAKPYIIYNNHIFNNICLSKKYKKIIDFVMINNDYKTWDDIKEIVISEERYESD